MKNFSANRLFSILLLLVPMFCFSQNIDDVSAISCSGTIYDNATQKPLGGATINITNSERNRKVTNTMSDGRGAYTFTLAGSFDIKVVITKSGYKKEEKRFTKEELVRYKWRIPAIYLDTTVKIDIKPSVSVRQSKEEFVARKLQSLNILPEPAAHELFLYLNPDLRGRDSLMSNDNIILPKVPRISNSVKRANKEPFQAAKRKDGATQNRLRDTIDKVARILGDDIMAYKIKYDNTTADAMRQMREYLLMDLRDYRPQISNTSKLKAEELIELLSRMGELQERMVVQRALRTVTYENMKMLWQDLSYLLFSKRYMLFTRAINLKENAEAGNFITAAYFSSGSERVITDVEFPLGNAKMDEADAPTFEQDEVGYFGFLIWSERLTSNTKPDLSEPGSRYLIRYFKPALAADTSRYQICQGSANVATTNLTRARYGIEVYDTKEGKYVQTVHKTFTTEQAFNDSKYDAWFTPDFKEIKYILVHLK